MLSADQLPNAIAAIRRLMIHCTGSAIRSDWGVSSCMPASCVLIIQRRESACVEASLPEQLEAVLESLRAGTAGATAAGQGTERCGDPDSQ